MKALNDWVLVEEVKEEIVQSGLVLTDQHVKDMRYGRGKVVSAGDEAPNTKVGDEIYFDKSRSFALINDGTKTTVIRYRDVIAIL